MFGNDSGEYHADYMLMLYRKDESALYMNSGEALENLLAVWMYILPNRKCTQYKNDDCHLIWCNIGSTPHARSVCCRDGSRWFGAGYDYLRQRCYQTC